jgi:glycosyltransferase involved in cell wall biosynthesis
MEAHALWLADMLTERGHSVHVITTEADAAAAERLASVTVVRAQSDRWSRAWFSAVAREVTRLNPTLVVGESTAACRLASRWPTVSHLHGTHWNELIAAWAIWGRHRLRRAVRRTAELLFDYARWGPWRIRRGVVVALTAPEAAVARRLFWIPEANLKVVGNPVDESVFRPREDRRPTVVFAGRLDPSKGVDLLLRAFAASGLSDEGFSLDVAGDGPQRAELLRLAAQLGLSRTVTFHGSLAKLELAHLLGSSRIACFPSVRRESLSLSLMEAMAAGCAIVASYEAGLDAVVTHPMLTHRGGPAGLVLTGRQVSVWAHALRRLADDPAHAADLGANARQIVSAFSELRVGQEIESAYMYALGLFAENER